LKSFAFKKGRLIDKKPEDLEEIMLKAIQQAKQIRLEGGFETGKK
jgi:hypothetical protein